jgi:hypothetical protein
VHRHADGNEKRLLIFTEVFGVNKVAAADAVGDVGKIKKKCWNPQIY